MAQKILIRRGGIENLSATIGVSKGELIYASGSVNGVENVVLIANADGNNTFTPVNKLYSGTAAANSFNAALNGTPYYKTDSEALFILNNAGSTALDLSGNLEGTTVDTLTVTNLTTSNVSLTGDITGSNMLLSGNADIQGDILLGGSITIGNQTTDNIQVGGEFTSDLIPDADSTYNLGSNTQRWLNIYADNVSGSTADFASTVNIDGATTLGSTLEVTTGVSSSGYLYAGGALDVAGNATIDGTATITGVLTADTGISSSTYLYAAGNLDIDGTSVLTGDTSIGGALAVTTGVSSSGYVYAGTNLDVDGNATVGGNLALVGDFAINGTAFTVSGSSGATTINGNLTLAGQANLNGDTVIGNAATDTVAVKADVSSSLIPYATNTFDLGSSSDKWRFGYFVSASIESLSIAGIDPTAQTLDDVMNNGASTDNDFSLTKDGDQQITHQGTTGNLVISSNNGSVKIENTTFTGNDVIIPGDLTVQGTTTTIDSTIVNIGDNIITLNAAGTVADGGIQVIDTTGTTHTGSFLWNATNDYWYAGISGSSHYRVATFTNASPVSNAIPVIDANKRLVASSITDDGTTVSVDANVEVTGSVFASSTLTADGIIDSSSSSAIRFSYINASKQLDYITPAVSGDLIQWNGTAMVASNIIDGGTF